MKRLIVLCDGTGQSVTRGDEAISTNVKRFGDCLAQSYTGSDGKTHPQILYYQSGVGTASTGEVSKKFALGTGAGIADNILDAYAFLCNNYALPSDSADQATQEANADEICIFGFSRGAFTARLVANLVLRLGLLKPQQLWLLKPAWAQYMNEDRVEHKDDRPDINFECFVRHLHAFNSNWTRKVKVKILGVWDTVGALGLPQYPLVQAVGLDSKQKLYDTRLLGRTEYAFHALAIDEYRLPFGPTLFHHSDPDPDKPVGEKTVLKQCWFAGAHTDVGGGYESNHQANISLAWMIDQCLQYKLLEFYTTEKYGRFQKTIRDHLSPANLRRDRLQQKKQSWFGTPSEAPCENKYPGWGCGIIRDSFKEMPLAVSWQYRAPGNYSSPRMCEKFPNKHYTHPGAAGRGSLPGSDTFEAGKEAVTGFFSRMFGGSGKSAPEDEYCTEEGCRHPIRSWDGPGGTNETIHASVWARFEALKQMKLQGVANIERSKFLNIDWAPPALSAFLHNGKYTREEVGKDDIARKYGYTHKWVGRCIVSKKLFAMYEEPDNFKPGDEIGELQFIDPNTKTLERLKYPHDGMMYQIHYDPDSKVDAEPVGRSRKKLDNPQLGITDIRKKELGEIRWKYWQPGYDLNDWREDHADWKEALDDLSNARKRLALEADNVATPNGLKAK